MPWTIWRYTFIELLRIVFLSTAVLVAVIAFAASIKPLAEGTLTPLGAVRFMLMAVPPMLAYALPFSAGFGASMVYHRMAQDNETVAAHSGGISHRALLVPAMASALLLGGSVSMLNEWVIPRFLQSMERMITLDVTQMMIRQIERGQAAELGTVMIYAQKVDPIEPPEGSPARQMFLMHEVVAVQLDDLGRVESDVTVKRAWLVLASDPNDPDKTICGIQLEDGVGSPADGGLRKIETGRLRPVRIPDAFEEDPKYMTFQELRSLRNNPDGIDFVDLRRLRLAEALAKGRLGRTLEQELKDSGRIAMLGDGGRRYEITADRIALAQPGVWRFERDDRPVRVRRYEPGGTGDLVPSTDHAQNAWIRLEPSSEPTGTSILDGGGPDGPSLKFALQLVDVRTESAGGNPVERTRRDFRGLRMMADPLETLVDKRSEALLDEADRVQGLGASDPAIDAAAADSRLMIEKLGREITSKQHERMAMSLAAAVMLMLGSITGLRHKDSLPLVVYLWSFFPALVMVLLISSGQQHTHGESVPVGVAILWSGVAAGAVISLIQFFRLARH